MTDASKVAMGIGVAGLLGIAIYSLSKSAQGATLPSGDTHPYFKVGDVIQLYTGVTPQPQDAYLEIISVTPGAVDYGTYTMKVTNPLNWAYGQLFAYTIKTVDINYVKIGTSSTIG